MQSFKAVKLFKDAENFPYGFNKCGEFTREQARLLEKHGFRYKSLAEGESTPLDEDEQDFVDFCKGLKSATSPHEEAWKLYLHKVEQRQPHYSRS